MEINNKIFGAMYGVAVGDALGAPLEFMSADEIRTKHGTVRDMIGGGWLNVEPGEVTDDTMMTLAVANGIVENPEDPIQAIGKRFIEWYETDPKDIGNTCRYAIGAAREYGPAPTSEQWLNASLETHYALGGKSAGNGSLMRTVYVGLYYSFEIAVMAEHISRMTHFDVKTGIDCAAYSLIISTILNPMNHYTPKENICQVLNSFSDCRYRYTPEKIAAANFKPRPTGYVVDSFTTALHCILTTSSFEEAVVKAVNLGGDADTIGAITGGLAGAIYGYDSIPDRWTNALQPGIRAELSVLSVKAAEQWAD